MTDYTIPRTPEHGGAPIIVPNQEAKSFRYAFLDYVVASLAAAGWLGGDVHLVRNAIITAGGNFSAEWRRPEGAPTVDLRGAVMREYRHSLDDLNLLFCDVEGADFSDCDASYAYMTEEQARSVVVNRNTRFPYPLGFTICRRCNFIGTGFDCEEGYCSDCCNELGHQTCDHCGRHGVLTLDDRGWCTGCVAEEERERGRLRSITEAYEVLGASARAVGIEWEINGLNNAAPLLSVVRAGSHGVHRDGSCGWEVVTRPIADDAALEREVYAIGRALQDGGVRVDSSCSVHVHVDARDMRWGSVALLCHLHARLEPLLFALCGQNRVGNRYCSPFARRWHAAGMKTSSERVRVLCAAFGNDYREAVDASEAQRKYSNGVDKKDEGRYCALNLVPWLAGRGNRASDTTVEFRMHRDTSSSARVLGWVRLVRDIVDWCVTHSLTEFSRLPSNDLKALFKVSPRSRAWVLRRLWAWHGGSKRSGRTVKRGKDGRWVFARDGFCIRETVALKPRPSVRDVALAVGGRRGAMAFSGPSAGIVDLEDDDGAPLEPTLRDLRDAVVDVF